MVTALVESGGNDQLPVYLTRFFGRDSELSLLAELLGEPDERLITLVGPSGVGKTRLLIEAVKRADLGEWLFVDGVALGREDLLLPEMVDSLGIDRGAERSAGEVLSEHLAGRQLTILIDNMEHLLGAAVDIAALVRALPGLRIITTSRAPMHISGEYLLPIEPLKTTLGSTNPDPSVAAQIFIDRARRTGKLRTPTSADLTIVETICNRLDGLPLAIELAAARLRILSLPALLAVLTNQLSVLTGGPIDVTERHRALRAAIGWSYELLDEVEQRLLRELGVFIESFVLDGVDAVCTRTGREMLDVIESLYDQAMLRRIEDDPTGLPRYSMLSSIRAFALEQLCDSGDESLLRERHAAWFLGLAETLEPNLAGSGQQEAIERLNRSTPNLRQALDFLIDRGDQESALRLATALNRYWLIRSQWEESKRIFATIFAMGESRPTRIWGAALRAAAMTAETTFDNETALALDRRALAIWEELGDTAGMARTHIDLGNVYSNLGHFDDAAIEFGRAAELTNPVTDPRTLLVARGSIGISHLRKGSVQDADRVFTEILPELRTFGDLSVLSTCLSNAAVTRQRLGDNDAARALLEESLSIRERLGDEYGIGVTLINLCDVTDDRDLIERESRRVLEIALRLGATDLASAARTNLGESALVRGERAAAAAWYVEALDGYAAVNDESAQADLIGLISELGVETNPADAVRLLGAAREMQTKLGVQPVGPVATRVASVQERLRQLLGDEAFEQELVAGRQLTVAEARLDALALARQGSAYRAPALAKRRDQLFGGLTARELDVLHLITEGKTDRQIADALFITPKTANHHVTRILSKLECRNRAAATALAFQHGLV